MTATDLLITGPVALPLLAAGVALLISRWPMVQRGFALVVLAGVAVDAGILLRHVDTHGPLVAHVGGHRPPLGITLVADRFSALLLVVSSTVLLLVLVYAIGQGILQDAAPSIVHVTYLALTAGVSLALVTGDLFNLFVALEVMLMASYTLITLRPNAIRTRAGMTYIVTSLLSSMLLLSAVGTIYGLTGTLNLAQLSHRMADLPADVQTWLSILLLVSLAIKAAIVPLHWWLPESYPPAPAPVTAIFAALLTKVAVYAIIRTQTLLFPRDEPWTLLLVLAAATLLVGSVCAVAQRDLHGALSFLLVSHIGFMLLGLAVSTRAGVAAAAIYLVHHIAVQAALFAVVGLIERHRGTALLDRLGGLAVTAPLLSMAFFLPALSVSGIPPLDGFVAKLAVLRSAVATEDGGVLAVAGIALVASLLTLVVMARAWLQAFWGEPVEPVPDPDPSDELALGVGTGVLGMTAATVCLVVLGLGIAGGAGPLSALTDRVGQDLRVATDYREAVLGGGSR